MQTPNPTATNSPYAGHTPGPWCMIHERPSAIAARKSGCDFYPVPGNNWHWKITRFSTPCGEFIVTGELDTIARRRANARLIAAAPMLLQEVASLQATNAALRAALEWALEQIEDELSPDHQEALKAARAALAAKGVQS